MSSKSVFVKPVSNDPVKFNQLYDVPSGTLTSGVSLNTFDCYKSGVLNIHVHVTNPRRECKVSILKNGTEVRSVKPTNQLINGQVIEFFMLQVEAGDVVNATVGYDIVQTIRSRSHIWYL